MSRPPGSALRRVGLGRALADVRAVAARASHLRSVFTSRQASRVARSSSSTASPRGMVARDVVRRLVEVKVALNVVR